MLSFHRVLFLLFPIAHLFCVPFTYKNSNLQWWNRSVFLFVRWTYFKQKILFKLIFVSIFDFRDHFSLHFLLFQQFLWDSVVMLLILIELNLQLTYFCRVVYYLTQQLITDIFVIKGKCLHRLQNLLFLVWWYFLCTLRQFWQGVW